MNMMQRKIYAIALAALMMATTSLADDVEIYFSQSSLTSGEPLVMFSLDYRPNLASSICNFGAIEDCGWDAEINKEFSVDDRADGTIDFLEMLRAALRRVLSEVSGLRVGLMLNHNHINNCEAQSYTKGCSNGGYIAQGFESIDGLLRASDHQAITAFTPPNTTAGADVDVIDAFGGDLPGAPDIVFEIAVSAVDDRVAGRESLAQLGHDGLGRRERRSSDRTAHRSGSPHRHRHRPGNRAPASTGRSSLRETGRILLKEQTSRFVEVGQTLPQPCDVDPAWGAGRTGSAR